MSEPTEPPDADDDELARRAVAAFEKTANALESIARELHVANGLRAPDFP